MNSKNDLAIIIVSYNTKKLTLKAIDSIFSEGSKIRPEVIVVDNNSTDGSLKSLEELSHNKKIVLIKNQKNLGFARANNQAIKIANSVHVMLLNSDTVVHKGSFKTLLEFVDNTQDAGVVGPRLYNEDGSIQPSCSYFPNLLNAIKAYWLGKSEFFDKFSPKGSKPVKVDSLVGAAFLITRKALDKVGSLNEKYFFYFEDIDYCRKVALAGLYVYYLPSAGVTHYHGASGKHIADNLNQWRRLIPSSKIYHGTFKHNVLTFILWSGQKWQKFLKILN